MAYFDLCTQDYSGSNFESPADLKGRSHWLQRRFVGSQLSSLTQTATDNFKVFKIGKNQSVKGYKVIVYKADNTSITISLGYITAGGAASSTAFASAAVNLNAAATTFAAAAGFKTFLADGAYILLTLSDLANLDAACEFEIGLEVVEGEGNFIYTGTDPI